MYQTQFRIKTHDPEIVVKNFIFKKWRQKRRRFNPHTLIIVAIFSSVNGRIRFLGTVEEGLSDFLQSLVLMNNDDRIFL